MFLEMCGLRRMELYMMCLGFSRAIREVKPPCSLGPELCKMRPEITISILATEKNYGNAWQLAGLLLARILKLVELIASSCKQLPLFLSLSLCCGVFFIYLLV